jgi:hypothetical protein
MAEAVVEADIHRTGWVARSIGGQNENWILLSQSGGRISAYRAATYLLGGNWARMGSGYRPCKSAAARRIRSARAR